MTILTIFYRTFISVSLVAILCSNVFAIQKPKNKEPFSFNSQNNSCNLQLPPAADILLNKENIAPGGKLSVSLRPKAELNNVTMKFSEQGNTLSFQSTSNQQFAIQQMKYDELVDLQIPLPLELTRTKRLLPQRNEIIGKIEPKTYLIEVNGTMPSGTPAYSADIIVFEELAKGSFQAITLADYLQKHIGEQGSLDVLPANVIKNPNGIDSKAKPVQSYDKVIDAGGNEQTIFRTEKLTKITGIQSAVTVVVSGYIYFQDSDGNPHPLPSVEVAVWEDDGSSAWSSWDWRALTNSAGYYQVTVTEDEPDNELELFIRLRTINTWLSVEHPVGSAGEGLAVWGDYPYQWTGPTINHVVAGTQSLDYTINNSEKGAAQLFEWLMQAYSFTINYSYNPGAAQAVWPIGSGAGSYLDYNYNLKFGSIYANRNSHDVAYHEFGHLTMYRRNGYRPIGSGGPHYLYELATPGMAWSEGFATAYAQFINPDGYYDAANFTFRIPVENTGEMTNLGIPTNLADNSQHHENRVAGALFDFYDYGEPTDWDDPANYIVYFPEIMTLIANNNFNSTIDFYNSLLSSGYLTNLEKSFASRVMINNTFNVPYISPLYSGTISSNTTWDRSGTVVGNVTVNSGVTLTILPSLVISFAPGTSLIVNGTLNAVGTLSNPITFTSQSGTTNSSWGTITLNGSSAAGSTIKYANIKYGTKVQATNTSNVTIQYCNIDTTYDGIRFYNSTGSILNNTITTNSIGHGIVIENASTATVNDNVIKKTNTYRCGVGIDFGGGAGGNAARNDIYGWDWGICAIWGSSPLSYSNQAMQKNNRIRNCNTGFMVYRLSYPGFGFSVNVEYSSLNSLSNNTYNARVGTSYPEYESILYAYSNWWGSNPPNTSLFQVGYSSQFYYNPYLFLDPWSGIPKISMSSNNETKLNKVTQIPDNGLNPLLEGIELRLQNKLLDAKNYFMSYLANHPDNQQAYVELYNCYSKETADEIIKFFSSLPEKASKDHKLLLAYLYLKNGDFKNAKEVNNSIIAENPNTVLATKAKLNNVYIALYNEDNINEAITIFNYALSKSKLSTTIELSQVHNAIETYGKTYGKEINGLAALPNFESSEQDLVKQEGLNKIGVPDKYQLLGNYPNPFNPSTTISYALPYQSSVEIIIYDLMGKEIKSFTVPSQSAGYIRLVWDGKNESGNPVTSGVYFYRISIKSLENNETFIKTAKMLMLK